MPLTQLEKEKICRFSGWPLLALVQGNVFYNNFFAQWLLSIDLTDSMADQVRVFITRIDAIDEKLQEATSRLSASSVGHNEIVMNPEEISALRMERRRVIREMKRALNIPEYRGR